MAKKYIKSYNNLSIYHSLRFRVFLVLILATVSIGETEMDQSSSNENFIENIISSVSPSYPRTNQGKGTGSGPGTETGTVISKAAGMETGMNITMSVISTTVNHLSGTIVAHPTISYLDTETVHYINDRGFTTPHFHKSDARWGPFFEEGTEPQNITANLGSTVILDCRIGLLHDKTVTWLHHKEDSIHLLTVGRNVYSSDERITLSFRYPNNWRLVTWLHHKEDSIHLLTVGRNVYSSDERITLSFRYPNNWRLVIVYVSRHDEGLYECQVATHPPKVKRLFLKILVPEVFLVDELSREVTERYYKEGSTLELTCLGLQTDYIDNNIQREVTWKHGDQTITKGISSNISTSSNAITSTLVLTPIEKQHSGNYTCAVNGLTSATVSIHVLNGESPAAVVGNSVKRTQSNIFSVLICILCIVYR